MTNHAEDIAYEMHLEDERISELYQEWKLLFKEIKFNDSDVDEIKVSRIRDIEYEFDNYIETREDNYPENLDWLKTWSPLSKEEKLELKKTQGGRPKEEYKAEQEKRLRKRYYQLRNNDGKSKTESIDILVKEFSHMKWTFSTIETYLKK